ncbi:hypothetical protein M409DRAFT_69493 [Zasmidium cellare ATCC 36951]|uniref:Uncharacterized protein n=1 Tax=Zasmidium cellare ATCC 36951 TaxID=1080233 RepID=A0A6A6C979_ZASCE|nr:uncharacterized protein M409DRAFT_69493 [Zasmidium cellare ATCC 36951]KAF2161996.1 hypothetical protein M409DRAFT_69493 [Zasmidium cellare ATCC 36951]
MAFEPIFNSFSTRPTPQALRHPTGSFLHLLRDNFSITTWLLFGALLQGLACLLLPYPNIALIAPVTLFLFYKLFYITLIALALIPDPLAKNVIPGRSTPPSGQSVTAILLATRANSSLGIFSPGFKEVGDYFASFIRDMNSDPTRYGYLGSNTLLSANGDQATGAESMGLVYFKNEQKLHELVHGPSHTAAVEWYMRNGGRDFAHIGLMHEAFAAPRNGWEGIYLKFKPTGLGATTKEVEVEGKKVWMSPLVKGKGRLSYSKGRMGRPFGTDEWTDYDKLLGDDEKAPSAIEKA